MSIVLLCITYCCLPVHSMPRSRVPLEKKGALAWSKVHEKPASGRVQGGVNRLHVHAVDDGTNVAYTKEVRKFLSAVKAENLPFADFQQRDVAMADFMSDLCYIHQAGISRGTLLFCGFLAVFPEHKGHMPETCRALAGWQRLAQGGEGGPLASCTIAAIAMWMTEKGWLLEALALLLSEDCYLREQDWHQLTKRDLFATHDQVSIVMGVRERGQKVKTGSNQGVTIDRAYVGDALLSAAAHLAPDDHVFPFDPVQYRRRWWAALNALGLGWCGPPHNVRHSGPAADIATARRDLELVRRRGRWASATSVQRYTKDFRLVEHLSRIPNDVRSKGDNFLKSPRATWAATIQASPSGGTDIGIALVRGLTSDSAPRLCQLDQPDARRGSSNTRVPAEPAPQKPPARGKKGTD